MWRDFMNYALAKLPEESFTQPTINRVGVKPILRGEFIDATQLLQTVADGGEIDITQIYNNIHNILHFVNKNNPTGPDPIDPRNDPQYENWEYAVQAWKKETYGLPFASSTTPE
jgi:hypothetical protein